MRDPLIYLGPAGPPVSRLFETIRHPLLPVDHERHDVWIHFVRGKHAVLLALCVCRSDVSCDARRQDRGVTEVRRGRTR